MAFEFSFDKLQDEGSCNFTGRFKWKGAAIPVPLFSVRFVVKCGEASWYELFSDCDEPEVEALFRTAQYIDTDTTPDTYYIVKAKEISRKTQDDCLLIKIQWEVWTSQGPVNPVKVSGKWSTPIGDVEGEGGPMSQISGQELVRICCVKSDDGCVARCTVQ
jgi:hypothetical protein